MSKQIKKQLKFVEWLREHNIYNPNLSPYTMQCMQDVWVKMGGDK